MNFFRSSSVPRHTSPAITCALFALTVGLCAHASAASFQGLGVGPPGITSVQSGARAASADGSAVTGEYWQPDGGFFHRRGFRWTAATGMQDIGVLDPAAPEVQPLAISGDGSTIVGWARGVSGFQRPFLWTAAGGMHELGNVPGTDAVATGVSRDGRVVVGYYLDGRYHGFRWSGGATTDLGLLPGASDTFVRGACGLGDAAVGSTQTAGGRAFRWRAASGLQELPPLRAGALAYAEACSDSGNVAVGSSGDGKGQPPARWDTNGVRNLGTLGGNSGEAHGVSADGAVVVGAAGLPFVNGVSDFAAFRWTTATGKIEQLSKFLERIGVSGPFCHDPLTCPAGTWFLQLALGISADGNVVVGQGLNPNDQWEAFRAVTTGTGGGGGTGTGACAAGFTQLTLTVSTASGAASGTVTSKQTSSTGSALVVSSGQTGSACFQSNKTIMLQALNSRLANWSGAPAITCKNGNTAQNQCEFVLGTASQSAAATLR